MAGSSVEALANIGKSRIRSVLVRTRATTHATRQTAGPARRWPPAVPECCVEIASAPAQKARMKGGTYSRVCRFKERLVDFLRVPSTSYFDVQSGRAPATASCASCFAYSGSSTAIDSSGLSIPLIRQAERASRHKRIRISLDSRTGMGNGLAEALHSAESKRQYGQGVTRQRIDRNCAPRFGQTVLTPQHTPVKKEQPIPAATLVCTGGST